MTKRKIKKFISYFWIWIILAIIIFVANWRLDIDKMSANETTIIDKKFDSSYYGEKYMLRVSDDKIKIWINVPEKYYYEVKIGDAINKDKF